MITLSQFSIEQTNSPAGFYAKNAQALAAVGADAFGQPAETFGAQVAERFERAELAQIFKTGKVIVGFGLYNVLRGSLWQHSVN